LPRTKNKNQKKKDQRGNPYKSEDNSEIVHDQCENLGRREKLGGKKFIADKLCHH